MFHVLSHRPLLAESDASLSVCDRNSTTFMYISTLAELALLRVESRVVSSVRGGTRRFSSSCTLTREKYTSELKS